MKHYFTHCVISVAAAAGLCISSPAAADPVPKIDIPMELMSDATVTTDGGSVVRLSAGDYLVPGDRWDWLDEELKRYQKEVPRLEAENNSMKASLRDMPSTWYWIAAGFAAGFAAKMGLDEVRSW
jgi:hypothetical protein